MQTLYLRVYQKVQTKQNNEGDAKADYLHKSNLHQWDFLLVFSRSHFLPAVMPQFQR